MRKMKDSGIEWIGEIPEGWEVSRFKNVMHKEKVICEHYEGQDIISLTMNGVIKRDLENPSGKMPTTWDGYQFVEPEDLLLCLFDIDVTPRCVGLVKNKGLTSPAYSRFKVHKGYFNAYYNYLLRWIDDEKIFVHLSKNLRSSLTENDFGALYTIIPPLYEQQQIADFLDKKCSEIDFVISKTRETIEEYKKLKQSIITEVVTGKVKIENEKVCGKYDTYKDSGVEWIGEIPSEWEVKRLKFSSKVRNEKYSESYGVLEYFGLENIESHSAKFVETENIYDITQSQICRKDDIVFGKLRPYLAKVYEVPIDECCSSEFAVFYDFEGCNKYFKYLFLSYGFITIIDASTYGTKMPRANIDFIKNMSITLPCFETQQKIADYLDNKCSEIDTLIAKKEQLVVELEAYKKSLIYEVVTGKRGV